MAIIDGFGDPSVRYDLGGVIVQFAPMTDDRVYHSVLFTKDGAEKLLGQLRSLMEVK